MPVMTVAEARQLLESIEMATLIDLPDRALICLIRYSFTRVSAAANMNVEYFYAAGKRYWLRLHEKNGKVHEGSAGPPQRDRVPRSLPHRFQHRGREEDTLFRTAIGKVDAISSSRMSRTDILRMTKRRAIIAGISADRICCHTFRATGLTAYLENGGSR